MSPVVRRTPRPILKYVTAICALVVLVACVRAFLLTAEDERAPTLGTGLPKDAVMQQLLSQYQGMTVQELFDARYQEREYADELSFDPTTSKYFDRIRDKLKLTDEELEIYRRRGFVSVDHVQRYSFGSAYYQIYSADLPVFITSDSILNATHESFDAMLEELELNVLRPTLADVLEACHETLAAGAVPSELEQNGRDVDLYLTVARNLLDFTFLDLQAAPMNTLRVPSQFHQDEQVQALLALIACEKIQVPTKDDPTEIYGGTRFVDYSQFKPRGHYTHSPNLAAYFRCMMWLSRADTGWFVLPTDPHDALDNDPDRELRNAALLALLLEKSGRRKSLESVSRLLTTFVGGSDNLTITALNEILKQQGIHGADDLADNGRYDALAKAIEQNGAAAQRIRSQALLSPDFVPYTMPIPALVQMFGQSFVIDSLVLSNVVFDSILYNDEKIRRMMPMGLDVMAALGNDEALLLLEPELEKWHYSGNMMAASEFVDRCRPEFWKSRLYNVWLDALRTLDDEIDPEKHVPETLRTRVWQKKQLQTQLASWSELRHDTILVAKQSFSAVPFCEYPAGYVEPYPRFYRKLQQFAASAREDLVAVYHDQRELETGFYPRDLHDRHLEFFGGMIGVLGTLEEIARKELAAEELSQEQERFIKQSIDQRGSIRIGSGSRPRYDGWFCDLFYRRQSVLEWNPTIADVHTFPSPTGVSEALEVGVGNVNFCVIAVNCKDKSTAYVGPVYSYYEFTQPANDRLTDVLWQRRIVTGDLPERPAWTQEFRGTPVERTVDGISVALENNKFQLIFASNNQLPEKREFPNSDAGIEELVNYVKTQEQSDQLAFQLTGNDVSEKALKSLEQLPNLALLTVSTGNISLEAIDQFRTVRPDVHIRPEELRVIRLLLCDSVSGYGVYQPLGNTSLQPGDSFSVYTELGGVRSFGSMNGYHSSLQLSYQLIDKSGKIVAQHDFPESQRSSTELPRRFHLAQQVQLADDLPTGQYQFKVRISDTAKYNDLAGPVQPAVLTVESSIAVTVSDRQASSQSN